MNRLDEEEYPLKDLKQEVGKTASTEEDNIIEVIENEILFDQPD